MVFTTIAMTIPRPIGIKFCTLTSYNQSIICLFVLVTPLPPPPQKKYQDPPLQGASCGMLDHIGAGDGLINYVQLLPISNNRKCCEDSAGFI